MVKCWQGVTCREFCQFKKRVRDCGKFTMISFGYRASWTQSTSHAILLWSIILQALQHIVFSFTLAFPNFIFSSDFSVKILWTLNICTAIFKRRANLLHFDLITLLIPGEECKLWSSLLCNFLHPHLTSTQLISNNVLNTFKENILNQHPNILLVIYSKGKRVENMKIHICDDANSCNAIHFQRLLKCFSILREYFGEILSLNWKDTWHYGNWLCEVWINTLSIYLTCSTLLPGPATDTAMKTHVCWDREALSYVSRNRNCHKLFVPRSSLSDAGGRQCLRNVRKSFRIKMGDFIRRAHHIQPLRKLQIL